MSKKILDAAAFNAVLVAADDKTDLKALCQQVIDALEAGEQKIIVFTANLKEANSQITDLNNELTLASQWQSHLEDANSTINELRIQVGDLTEENEGFESKLDELSRNAGSGSSVLQQQLDEAYDTIAELGRKLDLQERTKKQQGILVEFDGKPKLLIGNRFQIKGVKYDAAGVAKSPEALAHLYNTGSHSLVDPVSDDNPIV